MTEYKRIMRSFDIYGDFVDAEPYGAGHINFTYKASFDQSGRRVNYLFQRINDQVFRDPESLMNNVSRICDHLAERAENEDLPDASRRVLSLIRSQSGEPWVRDRDGHYWRCYLFIEGAVGHDVVQTSTQAAEAARCFGEYLRLLADLPGGPLHETIPGFHHTPGRLQNLLRAVDDDPFNLASGVDEEISFFLRRRDDVGTLIELQRGGLIPERATHNDTKLNNVLIDTETQEGMCVIDMDTSMPGLSLYDFGDLLRSSTSPVPEDHRRPEEVRMDFTMFSALAEGFLQGGAAFLNESEITGLPEGGRIMTLEAGMRFLTDYLLGNQYFKTRYPEHNLVRCRTQIALVQSIEEQMEKMSDFIESIREKKKSGPGLFSPPPSSSRSGRLEKGVRISRSLKEPQRFLHPAHGES